MFAPFRLTISAPGETIADLTGVTWIYSDLADGGGIGILPGHAPLLAETADGPLRYRDSDGEHTVPLLAGVLEIAQGQATILTGGRVQPGEAAGSGGRLDETQQLARLAEALRQTDSG